MSEDLNVSTTIDTENQVKKAKREEALKDVKMYQANDWQLASETPDYFLLKKNESTFLVHLILFFVFSWWTFFIPNIIYHFASKKEKRVMKF